MQLDHESGLVGVSGQTSDVRELLRLRGDGRRRGRDWRSEMFVRRAAECIAAAATSLPAVDALVFTGGIGENAAGLRSRIVARLASIGVAPIADAAAPEDAILSGPGITPAVLRIEAREDLVVARGAARIAAAAGQDGGTGLPAALARATTRRQAGRTPGPGPRRAA